MKKIIFFSALVMCSMSVFSIRYLVQLGTEGAAAWTATEGGTVVNLSTAGAGGTATSFNTWFNNTTMTHVDEVWVAAGNFVVGATITLKDGVDIYGGFAGNETAVSGRAKGTNAWDFTNATIINFNGSNPANSGLYCATTFVNTTEIDGLSVTGVARTANSNHGSVGQLIGTVTTKNCYFYGNSYEKNGGTTGQGGGLYLRTGASANNCYFYDNEATVTSGTGGVRGGALSIAGNVTVAGCVFEDNTSAGNGGAVLIFTAGVANSSGGNFENCKFINNSATGNGGAIWHTVTQNHSANTILKNCEFTDNTAAGSGGGGAISYTITNSFTCNLSIEGCLFARNTSTTAAGAVFIPSNAEITVQYIKNCIFRDNKITTAGQNGAALHISRPTSVYNCVFANNSGYSAVFQGISNVKFYNNTFANNAPETNGAALIIGGANNSTIQNNVFWGNINNNINPSTGTLTTGYNAFDDNESAKAWYGSGSINTLTSGNTFISPTSFTGVAVGDTQKSESNNANWNIKTGCPAINAGADLAPTVTADILGNARPTGAGVVDMGAYEGIFITDAKNISTYATNSDIFVNAGGHLTVDAGKALRSLTVAPGGKVTVSGTNNVTTTDKITLQSSVDGTATLVDNYDNPTITATVEQFLPSGRQWWYLASPLSGATSNVIRPTDSPNLIGDYSESTRSYSAPFAANPATPLTAGKGYVVKFPNTDARTITFTGGLLNSGVITTTVTRTGTSAAKRGFNLVGNPYPSYIDWDVIHGESTNMRDAIWFRTYSADAVTTENPSGMKFHTYSDSDVVPISSGVTGKIAPMQAFWVKVDADPVSPAPVSEGTLTFNNTHREHIDTDPDVDYNPLKVKATDNRQRLRMTISNGTAQDEMLIVGKSYATNGLDSYDIEKMSNGSTSIPEIYSLVQNEELVINSMNELNAGAAVTLGIRPGQSGSFTLKVTQFENINNEVYLMDHLSNTETELAAGMEYSFTSDATATNERFSVEFRAPGMTTAVTESNVTNTFVFVNESKQISVQSVAGKDIQIRVFNMAGQQLASQQATGSVTVIQQSFNAGIYLVKVNNHLQKVVIN